MSEKRQYRIVEGTNALFESRGLLETRRYRDGLAFSYPDRTFTIEYRDPGEWSPLEDE